ELLAEAALEIVPGDTALIYVAVPGGGLELVAGTGAPHQLIGHREVAGAVAAAGTANRASIVDDLEARAIGVSVPRSRSAVVVTVTTSPSLTLPARSKALVVAVVVVVCLTFLLICHA